MTRVKQRLKDEKGETLAEALIASFLAAIGLLILATMIRTSHKMIDKSSGIVNTFYNQVNQIENRLISPENGSVTITDSNNTKIKIPVKIYKAGEDGLAMYTPE